MRIHTGQGPAEDAAPTSADSGLALLTEVDFKWLMAGQGLWIDSARFHRDPPYAADLLRLALASPSSVLRECAALLQAQLDRVAPGDGAPAA